MKVIICEIDKSNDDDKRIAFFLGDNFMMGGRRNIESGICRTCWTTSTGPALLGQIQMNLAMNMSGMTNL